MDSHSIMTYHFSRWLSAKYHFTDRGMKGDETGYLCLLLSQLQCAVNYSQRSSSDTDTPSFFWTGGLTILSAAHFSYENISAPTLWTVCSPMWNESRPIGVLYDSAGFLNIYLWYRLCIDGDHSWVLFQIL